MCILTLAPAVTAIPDVVTADNWEKLRDQEGWEWEGNIWYPVPRPDDLDRILRLWQRHGIDNVILGTPSRLNTAGICDPWEKSRELARGLYYRPAAAASTIISDQPTGLSDRLSRSHS